MVCCRALTHSGGRSRHEHPEDWFPKTLTATDQGQVWTANVTERGRAQTRTRSCIHALKLSMRCTFSVGRQQSLSGCSVKPRSPPSYRFMLIWFFLGTPVPVLDAFVYSTTQLLESSLPIPVDWPQTKPPRTQASQQAFMDTCHLWHIQLVLVILFCFLFLICIYHGNGFSNKWPIETQSCILCHNTPHNVQISLAIPMVLPLMLTVRTSFLKAAVSEWSDVLLYDCSILLLYTFIIL